MYIIIVHHVISFQQMLFIAIMTTIADVIEVK